MSESQNPPALRSIKGGRVTKHEPRELPDKVRLILIATGEGHILVEKESFREVWLEKSVSFTVDLDALALLED